MRNVNRLKWSILWISIVSICCASCIDEEPPVITSTMHVRIDSLYKKERKMRKKELDSLCDLRIQEKLPILVDSILQDRLEERRKRLGY